MLEPTHLSKLTLLGAPSVHPVERNQVVLSKAAMSIEKDMYMSELVVYDTAYGTEKPLLTSEQKEEVPADHSPAWSPDGKKLAFMRRVQGKDELWLYEADQHVLRPLVPNYKIKGFVWSPDGSKIAFVSRVNDVNTVAYKVKRIRFKLDGEGMTNGYTHIFLLDVKSGSVTQLTTRESDHGNPAFSSDGTCLYYSSDYPEGSDLDKEPLIYERNWKTGAEKVLRPELKFISSLFPLPDGSVVGTGKRDISSSTEYDKWFHVDGASSRTTWLSGQPDVHIGTHVIGDSKRTGFSSAAAAADPSRYVYAATHEGKQSLYVLELPPVNGSTDVEGDSATLDAKVMKLPLEFNVISFAVETCDEKECAVVFVGDTMNKPGELYRAVWTYGDEIRIQPLTDYHREFVKHLPSVNIQSYRYKAEDGLQVEGWSMQPSRDRSVVQQRGTMLWIHGGPHLSYGHAFHYDFWYWASLGYRVVFCNPRGSSGYGQAFTREIIGQWGGKDVTDVLGFLEMVLEKEGRGEEEPLYLLGGSYGGYLVNWIIGHDHRFKAAVTERSICNLYSKVGNSDIGFQNNPHQLGGKDLWTDEEHIMERSPIRYAPQVQTPVLIIHAEQDHRCPIEQAEQWFTALWRLGKDVEFIRFPGASHALATAGRPQQRIARLNGIREWLLAHA